MESQFVEGRYALKNGDKFLCAVPMGSCIREYSPHVGDAIVFSNEEHLALPVLKSERWVLLQLGRAI